MPSNWLSIDSNFPSFTGEESTEQQIMALHNYLFQLREGLQYSLQNLTADNFNTAALQNLTAAQKNEVTEQMKKVFAQLSQMETEIDRLSSRVSGTENLSQRVTRAEENVGKLGERMRLLEEDQSLEELQAAVTGEGGLQEQVTKHQQELEKLSSALAVAEDGSITLGTDGIPLRLVGQVYINGVLYGQGGTT